MGKPPPAACYRRPVRINPFAGVVIDKIHSAAIGQLKPCNPIMSFVVEEASPVGGDDANELIGVCQAFSFSAHERPPVVNVDELSL